MRLGAKGYDLSSTDRIGLADLTFVQVEINIETTVVRNGPPSETYHPRTRRDVSDEDLGPF